MGQKREKPDHLGRETDECERVITVQGVNDLLPDRSAHSPPKLHSRSLGYQTWG